MKGLVSLYRGKGTGKDAGRKQPSVNQEEGIHQEPKHAGTLILHFQPPALWEINVCCFSRLVYGNLLWQPTLTKTEQTPPGTSQRRKYGKVFNLILNQGSEN